MSAWGQLRTPAATLCFVRFRGQSRLGFRAAEGPFIAISGHSVLTPVDTDGGLSDREVRPGADVQHGSLGISSLNLPGPRYERPQVHGCQARFPRSLRCSLLTS